MKWHVYAFFFNIYWRLRGRSIRMNFWHGLPVVSTDYLSKRIVLDEYGEYPSDYSATLMKKIRRLSKNTIIFSTRKHK